MNRIPLLIALLWAAPGAAQDIAVEPPPADADARAEARIAAEEAELDAAQAEARQALRETQRADAEAAREAVQARAQAVQAEFRAAIDRDGAFGRGGFLVALRRALDARRAGMREVLAMRRDVARLQRDHAVARGDQRATQREQRAAQARRHAWLRENGLPPVEGARAIAESVLPFREGTDLHARFFEVAFRPVDGEALRIVEIDPAERISPRLYDACDPDRYFLHFPARHFPAAPADAVIDAIVDGLQDRAEHWWFADQAEPRGVVPVRHEASPGVVRQLRAAAVDALGDASAQVRIGRVCTFTNQVAEQPCDPDDPPPAYSPEDATWHLRGLGFSDQVPQPATGEVHVALVDSGIDASIIDGIEHVGAGLAPAAVAGANKIHGTQMALLIQQVLRTPAATLHSYRVFDETNTSDPHRVARALSRAAFGQDIPADAPTVINLSLGWPPELAQRRRLEAIGDGPIGYSRATEDGVGESVRAVLDAISVADVGDRTISVLSAAGNRPRSETAASLREDFGLAGLYGDDCLGKIDLGYQWFFPAEWYATPTCELDGDAQLAVDKRRINWAVGATDSAGEPAYVGSAQAGEEPPLVAPGELVVIDGPAPAIELELPTIISGTSASAALTSAVAAWAQVVCTSGLVAGCPDGLSQWQLGQILYHAAQPTERGSRAIDQTGPRAVNWCRTAALLACDADVLGCLGSDPFEQGSRLLTQFDCQDGGGDTIDERVASCVADNCPGIEAQPAPTWTDAYTEWFECTADADATTLESEVCDDGPCAHETEDGQLIPDEASVGKVGPQPGGYGCPTCAARVNLPQQTLEIYVVVTDQFKAGTSFKAATLELIHSDAPKEAFAIADDIVSTWAPGDKITVTADNFVKVMPSNWDKSKAVLRLTAVPPSGATFDNESVVTLTVDD